MSFVRVLCDHPREHTLELGRNDYGDPFRWCELCGAAEMSGTKRTRWVRPAQERATTTHRLFPITRFNSTVLGQDVRGHIWDRWWREARWGAALPTTPQPYPCLNVPVPDYEAEGDTKNMADPTARAWYRVRPRNGRGVPVLVNGIWHWEYTPPPVNRVQPRRAT